jgi:4-diphosphocytidyl-2-C-methyl-D-erythritol kinase
MATRVRSFAKINLGLAIGPVRPDGYHALATVYQTIGLHDFVTVSARAATHTSIAVTSTHAKVPADQTNTAWRMVEQALDAMKTTARVSIHIEKLLPVQGGLGAGSSNAVAALIGLERGLPAGERLRIAAEVGSDVPLFLIGGTVLGLGRGEQVYPLPDLPATACVVATPEVGVSTPQAFREWDARHTQPSGPAFGLSLVPKSAGPRDPGALTERHPSATLERLSRAVAGVWSGPYSSGVSMARKGPQGDLAGNSLLALVHTGIENDFEEVVFPQHSLLGEIKQLLATSVHSDEQAIFASLSGSGASLFGLYGSEIAASAAQQRLAQKRVPGLVTETLTRERYWDEMFVASDDAVLRCAQDDNS